MSGDKVSNFLMLNADDGILDVCMEFGQAPDPADANNKSRTPNRRSLGNTHGNEAYQRIISVHPH